MENKFEFTREWFQNPKNQVHTRQDADLFGIKDNANIVEIGEHFLLDLYPVFGNGELRDSTDVEIWEVENTEKKIYHKERHCWLPMKAIRKITTGKQFGYPNGYWKVPKELNDDFCTTSEGGSE